MTQAKITDHKRQLLSELIASRDFGGVTKVWYGHIEQAEPVDIDDAIRDIAKMDPDAVGEGSWGEWPEEDTSN